MAARSDHARPIARNVPTQLTHKFSASTSFISASSLSSNVKFALFTFSSRERGLVDLGWAAEAWEAVGDRGPVFVLLCVRCGDGDTPDDLLDGVEALGDIGPDDILVVRECEVDLEGVLAPPAPMLKGSGSCISAMCTLTAAPAWVGWVTSFSMLS